MNKSEIEAVVLRALDSLNLARDPSVRLEISPQAAIFGPDSPLDSLGLVSLLIDIEEALSDRGFDVMLSDERAMSARSSPFRSVATLIDHIQSALAVS